MPGTKQRPTPQWVRDSTAYSGVRQRYLASDWTVPFDAMAYPDGRWEVRIRVSLDGKGGASGREDTQEDACKRALIVAYALTDDLKALEDS